ncbi:hypothetical protein KAR91_16465 [Candidatus Pacearchaeota archaeon]|nr:hypothetical protein [Candidatus Pacearchaeota archaeon]
MSIAWTSIKVALHTWVSGQSGITTIWANQNAPQPATPYITLNIISGPVKIGGSDTMFWDDVNDVFVLGGERQFTLSIQSFGAGGLQAMSDLLTSTEIPPVITDSFTDNGLAVGNNPAITDLTQMLSTTFEERKSMDVIFYTMDNTELTMTYIESVELNAEITSDKGTLIQETHTVTGV